jgi:glyoxylase-like metal-dependent hydrolase (beta-lactamase superfamily II)
MRIGDLHLHPVSDGTFIARPAYFGPDLAPDSRPEFFRHHQAAWLPIGCFVVRTRDRVVLIDAGLGPERQEPPGGMHLVGGQLPTGLRALGIAPDDITDVICSHLHADHVGWLFGPDARPFFAQATIWFGAADWRHFVAGDGEMLAHISSGRERALLLGDAITCPIQLEEPAWHSMADVDPLLADRTRARLWRELEGEQISGTGAHFPELRFGRVLPGTPRQWFT